MNKLILVVVGGGIGSGARYLVALGSIRLFGPEFPWGTFAVNVLGSFLLGLILGWIASHPQHGEIVRLAFGTGVMGGFTTYSSFNAETLRMIESGTYGLAAGYAGMTFVVCLVAGTAGLWLESKARKNGSG